MIFFFSNIYYILIYFILWLSLVLITLPRLSLVWLSGGYSLVAAHELLIVVVSLVAEHRL